MPKEQVLGEPQTRRYTPEEKAAAVRMVRTLRAELGTGYGTVQRVAHQFGYGVESVRLWVKQASTRRRAWREDRRGESVSRSEAGEPQAAPGE